MKSNLKKNVLALIITSCALIGYFFWFSSRPIEVIAVHEDGNYSFVLVKKFPITDKGKIDWWLKNKDIFKNRYDIPKPAAYGGYDVTFWNFGDGYKEDKYDRLCFDDMKTKMNCINKEPLLTIKRYNYEREIFITYEGRYKLKNNGEITKVHR
ncbi:DUF943 family protein [Pantoea agglomerans]|uniref:DUF943 domain-containing protein n=1 Tax=Enterobacter agglomerans TaxID=549 RepID=A0AAN2K807_ENTAG|nr:DUF943 family protein [Pantoea agglomerans]CAH6345059.1 DUF943 domain-containing protein [Pantoea agglomerans]